MYNTDTTNPLVRAALESVRPQVKTELSPLELLQIQQQVAQQESSNSRRNTRMKRVRHSKQPGLLNRRTCLVCGEKAINYNFGVISCESCKAFFRRNIDKIETLQCSSGSWSCEMTVETRRFCSACRLKKCFEIGMSWQPRNPGNSASGDEHLEPMTAEPGRPSSLPHMENTQRFRLISESSRDSSTYSSDGEDEVMQERSATIGQEQSMQDDLIPYPAEDLETVKALSRSFQECILDAPFPLDTKSLLRNNDPDPSFTYLIKTCDFLVSSILKFLRSIPEFQQLRSETQKSLIVNEFTSIFTMYGIMRFDIELNAFVLAFEDDSITPMDMEQINGMLTNHVPSSTTETDQLLLSLFACLSQYQRYVMKLRKNVLGDQTELAAILFCMKVFENAGKHEFLAADSREFLKASYRRYEGLFFRLVAYYYPRDFRARLTHFKELQRWTASCLEPICEQLVSIFGMSWTE